MAKSAQSEEFWFAVVAEARAGLVPHNQIAAKHGISASALRYHLYTKPRAASSSTEPAAMLPVRLSGVDSRKVEVELSGGVRMQFTEGCDLAYIAALIAKLR